MTMKKIIAAISATALSAGILATSAFAAVTSDATIDFTPTSDDYEYAGYVGSLTGNTGDVLAIDITTQSGTNLAELRLEFTEPKKICWASENAEGTLYTIDGKTLIETEFPAGETVTVYIDLVKSGATACDFHVHTSGNATGAFKLANITLMDASEVPSNEEPEETTGTEEAPGTEETPGTEEAPANTTGSNIDNTDDDKGAPDTGIEGVAVIAGAAVLAAGVFVVAKKRK